MSDKVREICSQNVDRGAILRHAVKTSNNVLCIDGTSATKKTSILEKTGYKVTKLQKITKFQNINRYFPAMLGYICTGINLSKYGESRLNDRSPLNPLEWHVLWCCMSDFFTNHGNVYPIDLGKYKMIMIDFKNSFFYKLFNNQINCLAFIDSNCLRCDNLRIQRNENNDRERSQWCFYTPMQNLMYSVLYENRVIDMAWFDEFTIDEVCQGISMWINELMIDISKLNILSNAPLSMYHLPINFSNMDYALQNMTTHVHRCIGRVGCKIINQSIDKRNFMLHLKNCVPDYVSIREIQPPLVAIMHQNSSCVNAFDEKYKIKQTKSLIIQKNLLPIIPFNEEDGNFQESDFFS